MAAKATKSARAGASRKGAATAEVASVATGAMDIPYRRCNTLRLQGISLADYEPIESFADQRFLDETVGEDLCDRPDRVVIQTHEKMPTVFSGLEEWPLSTTLCCHECSMTFTGRPKFIPTFIREAAGGMGASRIEMGVRGNFCSWGCAELWIESRHVSSTEQRWRLQDNLRHAFHMFTGAHVAQIRAAHPREELLQYGGDLELDTWLRRNRELEPVADTVAVRSTATGTLALGGAPPRAPWGNAWRASPIELRADNVGTVATAEVKNMIESMAISQPRVQPLAPPAAKSTSISDDDFDKLLEDLLD